MSRIIDNPRELLLGKAKEILLDEGYSKLSMRNLSKACDIALGTIYNYYPTKKELVVEMMVEYWDEFFNKIDSLRSSSIGFYDKLHLIFDNLSYFIRTFKEVWLTPELYENPDYIKSGIEKENIYLEKIIRFVEDILKEEITAGRVQSKLGTHEAAEFIMLNFITIIQMPVFRYESFEAIIKKLI